MFSVKFTKKSLFIIALCLFSFIADAESKSESDNPVKVILMPSHKVVISPKIDGTVSEYKVKEGEIVEKDQLLALLDDQHYRQRKNKTESALDYAKRKMTHKEENYKLKVQLYQRGALGKMKLEESKFDAETAQDEYQQALANHKMMEFDLESCRITAPFNGRIVKKITEAHEYIKKGDPLLELVDDRALYAVIHYPSSQIDNIKLDGRVKIKITELGNKVFEARISEISAKIDPGSRTFEVKATVNNESRKLRVGMSGELVRK